jgi:hypothetical protein
MTANGTDTRIDFITGREVPDIGAEANRQAVERLLVEEKGYRREEVEVDVPIAFNIDGVPYRSRVDLAVRVDGNLILAIKCAAGSLGSREREILAAARLMAEGPVPLALVSDGRNAVVIDVRRGEKLGEGLAAVPNRRRGRQLAAGANCPPLEGERLKRERLIFRSYDSMNVNVAGRTFGG